MNKWIIVSMLAFLLIGCDHMDEVNVPVVVLDKAFVPGTSGSGVGISTSGKASIVSVSTDDTFKVLGQFPHGQIATVNVTQEQYVQIKTGDVIRVVCYSWHDGGGLFGCRYNTATK